MHQHAHVEHFRHGKILCGETVIGEEIEGNLAHREKPNGRVEWFGSFEISDSSHLKQDTHYQLVLPDGRVAEIMATEIGGVAGCHQGMHAVMYYVTGPIRGGSRAVTGSARKYGLDRGQKYLG
jgi:hypothetical protein